MFASATGRKGASLGIGCRPCCRRLQGRYGRHCGEQIRTAGGSTGERRKCISTAIGSGMRRFGGSISLFGCACCC